MYIYIERERDISICDTNSIIVTVHILITDANAFIKYQYKNEDSPSQLLSRNKNHNICSKTQIKYNIWLIQI